MSTLNPGQPEYSNTLVPGKILTVISPAGGSALIRHFNTSRTQIKTSVRGSVSIGPFLNAREYHVSAFDLPVDISETIVDDMALRSSITANNVNLKISAKLNAGVQKGALNNPWSKPPMRALPSWQPATAYKIFSMVVNGGNIYVANAGGTSNTGSTTAANGGPIQTTSTAFNDNGTLYWEYFGPNTYTIDQTTLQPQWLALTAYTLGQRVTNNGLIYACVVAGTSAASGGPTGTTTAITDSTAKWSYQGPAVSSPHAAITPSISSSATNPTAAGLTNAYRMASAGKFSLNSYQAVIAGGSGYAPGEVITLAGGTSSQAGQVEVVDVLAGGIIKSVKVRTPGVYSQLPVYPVAQSGASSGAGTGATFCTQFTDPYWCKIRGGFLSEYGTADAGRIYSFQPVANAKPIIQHVAIEFITDAPKLAFGSVFAGSKEIIIDGVKFSLDNISTADAMFYTLDFANAGGRKVRSYRIMTQLDRSFTGIYVDTNSTVWAPSDVLPKFAVISDSIWQGSTFGPVVPGNSVSERLALLQNVDVINMSIAGTGYTNRGASPGVTTDKFITRVAEAVARNPDIIMIMGSPNDIANLANIQSEAVAVFQEIRDRGFTGPIVVFGVWSYNNANVGAAETAVQNAVSTFADTLGKTFFIPIYYDPTGPWITGSWNNNPMPNGVTNTTSTNGVQYIAGDDNLHPVDLGTAYLASRIDQALQSQVYPNL